MARPKHRCPDADPLRLTVDPIWRRMTYDTLQMQQERDRSAP